MPAPMRSWVSGSVLAAVVCLGCSNPQLADSSTSSPTLLKLSPSIFLGEVQCLPGETGALQVYTVNLFEVSQELDGGVAGEQLIATSPPVSCSSAVSFQGSSTRRYVADVFGYDQTPAPGLEPRWTASCGRGPDGEGPAVIDVGSNEFGATRASLSATVPIVGCTYLRELTPTRVVVSLSEALGDLECGAAPGQVSDFVAVLDSQSRGAACAGEVTFSGVPVDTDLVIRVSAFSGAAPVADAGTPVDAGAAGDASAPAVDAAVPPLDASADAAPDAGPPVVAPPGDAGLDAATAPPGRVPQWTTQCRARASSGMVTRAVCDPLEPASN
jgi:hypothetical protein